MSKTTRKVPRASLEGARDRMKRDGAFDGRFGTKKVTSKKREESKRACRNFRWEG